MRSGKTFLAVVLAVLLCAAFAGAADAVERTEFTLESSGGVSVSLGRFAGTHPVLLVFWATWCPHCNAAVPEINEIHAHMGGRLKILALNYMENRQKVTAFMKAKGVAYPVLLDIDGKVARSYGIVGIPTYVLLDRQGKVVYFDNELPPSLEKYL
jgi:thiol-disulfide isomerase/thioredoxin